MTPSSGTVTQAPPDAPLAKAEGNALAAAFFCITLTVVFVAFLGAMPLTVFGLAFFGLLHVALELRYVIGRFSPGISQMVGLVLLLTLTVVVLARAVGMVAPAYARPAEIVAGAVVVGVGIARWFPQRWRIAALGALAVVVALALWQPGWYFYGLTHAHNLIPLVFLWDWAARRIPESRWAFVGVHLIWVVGVPVVVLSGLVDPILNGAPGLASIWVGEGAGVLASSAPPGATEIVAERNLLVFAVQQTMHYVVWIGFFTVFGREEYRRFDARFPVLRGRRLPILAIGAALALVVVFVLDYAAGKQLYSLISVYHVYLEFPVLLLLIAGAGELGRPGARVVAPGRGSSPDTLPT